MPLAEIRAKAQQLAKTTRRGNAAAIALFLVVLLDGAWQVWTDNDVLQRAGQLLIIAAMLHAAYRFHKHHRLASPAFVGGTDGLEFYRAELIRQLDLSQDSWAYLLPFAPGLGVIVLGRALEGRSAGQVTALVTLSVALFVLAAWLTRRTARRLQRDLKALDPNASFEEGVSRERRPPGR